MNFHSVNHKMWTGRNGTIRQIIRTYDLSTACIAIYLFTSPHSNQSGVYHCPISYIANETEQSPEFIEQALENLERIGFCKYDYDAQVVWVINLVKYQVQNWPGEKKDNRYSGVINALKSVPETYLVDDFCELWSIAFPSPSKHTSVHDQYSGGPCKPLASPLEAPSEDANDATEVIHEVS